MSSFSFILEIPTPLTQSVEMQLFNKVCSKGGKKRQIFLSFFAVLSLPHMLFLPSELKKIYYCFR